MSARHPTDEILLSYGAGRLRPAFALVAGAHLHGCARCRARMRVIEAVGGALLEEAEPVAMAPDAFARVMARIERPAEPIVLSDGERADILSSLKLRRRRWLTPGVWMAPVVLESGGGDLAYVLGAPAGARIFSHGHSGREFTAVLKGAYDDGTGRYGAGDFQETGAADEHQPVVSPDGDCICLIVSEAPMRMHSRLGKLAQLYLRV